MKKTVETECSSRISVESALRAKGWQNRRKAWAALQSDDLDAAIAAHINHPDQRYRLDALENMSASFAAAHPEQIITLAKMDSCSRVREKAVQALSKCHNCLDTVIACLSYLLERDEDMQLHVIAVLRYLLKIKVDGRPDTIVDVLIGLVIHPEAQIRCVAVSALAEGSWSGMVPTALGFALEDEDRSVRHETLSTLQKLRTAKDDGWASAAAVLLQDAHMLVRENAVTAFRHITWKDAPEAVRVAMGLADTCQRCEVREAALMALSIAAQNDASTGGAAYVVAARCLTDHVPAVRGAAAGFFSVGKLSDDHQMRAAQLVAPLLSRTGGGISTPGFLMPATRVMGYVGHYSDPHLVTHLLSHCDWMIRKEAVEALTRMCVASYGTVGDETDCIKELIRPLLKDEHWRVSDAARTFLTRMDPELQIEEEAIFPFLLKGAISMAVSELSKQQMQQQQHSARSGERPRSSSKRGCRRGARARTP